MTQARVLLAAVLSLALCSTDLRAAEKPAEKKPPPPKQDQKAAPAKKAQAAPAKEAKNTEDAEETPEERRQRLADLYQKAEEHFEAERYREAQRLYAQIALEQPGYKKVNARLRTLRDRLEKAERLARQARLERLIEAAEAHFGAANYAAAVEACEEALVLDPDNEHAQQLLVEASGELELQQRITAAIAGELRARRGPQVIGQAKTALTEEQPPQEGEPAEPGEAAPGVRADIESQPPRATRRVGPEENVQIVETERPRQSQAAEPRDEEGRRLLAEAWDTYQTAKLDEDPRPQMRKALDILSPITPTSDHSRHTKGTAALLRKSIARHLAAGPDSISKEEQAAARLYRRYLEGEEQMRKKHYKEAAQIARDILDQDPGFTLARQLRQEAGLRQIEAERAEKDIEHNIRAGKATLEVVEHGMPPEEVPDLERPDIDLTRPRYRVASPELEEKLNQRVSVNLIDADLDYFLDLLFRSTGVNIIYNPEVVADKTITVHVANYPLRQLLDYISRNHGLMFATTRDGILITTPEEPRLETFIIPLHHGLVDVEEAPPSAAVAGEGGGGDPWQPFTTSNLEKLVEMLPELTDWPDTGGVSYLDRKMNILYVRTTHQCYDQVLQLIESIDTQPVQVLVKALFIEVDAQEFERFGTELEFLNDVNLGNPNIERNMEIFIDQGNILTFPGESAPGAPAVGPEGAQPGLNLTFRGIMDRERFRLTLDLLQRLQNTRTLAAPNVVCMNNCTARIAVTRDLVYIEDYEVDRSDISGTTYGFPNNAFFDVDDQDQFFNRSPLSSEPVIIPVFAEGEDTGFTLDVSPSVGKDTRFITITLNPRIRELVEFRTFDLVFPVTQAVPPVNGNGDGEDGEAPQLEQQTGTVEQPVVGERSLTTKLTVADGSVVALGGLMQQREVQVRSKIPVLSDIPIIGDFFGRKTFGTQKTNLLIFVQCELITPTGARYADAGQIDEQAPPRGTPTVELRDEEAAPAVRRDQQP